MTFDKIPYNAHVFLDANILVYALAGSLPRHERTRG